MADADIEKVDISVPKTKDKLVSQITPEQAFHELEEINDFINKQMIEISKPDITIEQAEIINNSIKKPYTRAKKIKTTLEELKITELDILDNIISNIIKNSLLIITSKFRINKSPSPLLITIPRTNVMPFSKSISPITNNLWEFIRGEFIQNSLKNPDTMSIEEFKIEQSNMFGKLFNTSISQKDSHSIQIRYKKRDQSSALGRYGVVINKIELLPGGLYFICRMVDLIAKNPDGPNNNLPEGPLLPPNPPKKQLMDIESSILNGTITLPNVTKIKNLHVSIHSENSGSNQSHIKLELGENKDGSPYINIPINFMFYKGQNLINDKYEERIIICSGKNLNIIDISSNIADLIIERYRTMISELDQIEKDIINTQETREQHRIAIRNAFYQFLIGLENYLSYMRNADTCILRDRMTINDKTPKTYLNYKKYIKYKIKYIRLKQLIYNL